MSEELSDIGLIGLAVMGQNLALNVADHGFRISVYNRTVSKMKAFVSENPETPGGLFGAETLESFSRSLKTPRKIIILVQAGNATDAVIESLLPHLDKGDIIIDGGNAKWTDTIRRENKLRELGYRFIGSGEARWLSWRTEIVGILRPGIGNLSCPRFGSSGANDDHGSEP